MTWARDEAPHRLGVGAATAIASRAMNEALHERYSTNKQSRD
jgi:hypothetical protein